jgi:hypothetical protein
MRIIGLDPGKKNFAYAVLDPTGLVTTGILPTVTTIDAALGPQVARFLAAYRGAAEGADIVAFERMQHRPGLGGGGVVEYINLMIGLVCGEAQGAGAALYPVAAQTWKTHWRKLYGLPRGRFAMADTKLSIRQPKGAARKTKTEKVAGVLGAAGVSIHEADAIGIAAYCWERQIGGNPLTLIKNNL